MLRAKHEIRWVDGFRHAYHRHDIVDFVDSSSFLGAIVAAVAYAAEGVPKGDILSLIVVAAIALGFARLIMSRWSWALTRNLTVLSFLGWFAFLSTGFVEDAWGATAARVVGLGAILGIVGLFALVLHTARVHAGGGARLSRAQLAAAPRSSQATSGWRDLDGYQPRSARRANVFADAHTDENDLFTITAIALFAEFAVVSTGLIPPTKPAVGLVFFALLLGGCFLYLYHSYHRAGKTILYFSVTSIVSITASLLFGHYWWSEPWTTLLGVGYFASNAFSAGTTGIAFSLVLYARKR